MQVNVAAQLAAGTCLQTPPAAPVAMRPGQFAMLAAILQASCHDHSPPPPLTQRAYVWQREWDPPVAAAIARSAAALDGFVVLGAEIEWRDGAPHHAKPRVDWPAIRAAGKPFGLAMRIAPQAASAPEGEAVVKNLSATALDLIATAKSAGVTPAEFQLDHDCPQKKLAVYAAWVRAIRDAIKPLPLVITTLPAWLDEPGFPGLAREASRYVLQVHSVRRPEGEAAPAICDPSLARKWVAQAEKTGLPFEIALPTYRYQAGYDPEGRFIGIDSDGVRPNWPPGTRSREFASDPAAIAQLVNDWMARRPPHCTGLIWYRLPVGSDRNNWPLETLRAVMAGRAPRRSLSVRVNGAPPGDRPIQLADLSLLNDGESDDAPQGALMVTWPEGVRVIAEALPAWESRIEGSQARFTRRNDAGARLPPGAERAIGWLRLEPAAPIHVELIH